VVGPIAKREVVGWLSETRGVSERRACRVLDLSSERSSMDFMSDTLADGRPFRTLNIVDDRTRECMAIEVDRSLPGACVVRVLERLRATIGLPQTIVVANRPEFAGRTLDARAHAANVTLRFIRPGKSRRVNALRLASRMCNRCARNKMSPM
jgi:putative transposase